MNSSDGWVSRKRKEPGSDRDRKSGNSVAKLEQSSSSSSTSVSSTTVSSLPPSLSEVQHISDASTSSPSIPQSLLPHLGWTKVSLPCPVADRARARRNAGRNVPENARKVVGRAVFFLHDPNGKNSENSNDSGGEDGEENTTWFQGRFFPSFGVQSSVYDDFNDTTTSSSSQVTKHSWGLLGVQNVVIDECLRCSEGGYRELDLTVIRHITSTKTGKKKASRWIAKNVVWTGGDMMRLSTDDDAGVTFEPTTMMGGQRAMDIGAKYFPSLVKQLKIQHMANDDGDGGSNNDLFSEAIAVVGDMEIHASTSFVAMKDASRMGASSDDDGLWDD